MRDQGRGKMRAAIVVLAVASIAVAAGARADHGQGGSVVGGGYLTPVGCGTDPACNAWRYTCDPQLATRDGVWSSIVNIKHIAGTTKTFKATGTPLDPLARAAVYLFDNQCVQLYGKGPELTPGAPLGRDVRISIPGGAAWLVVLGSSAVDLHWTLR